MTAETLGHLGGLGCAATWAFATILYGQAAQSADPRALNLWKCVFSTVLLGLTALVLRDLPSLSERDGLALVVSAVLGLVVADTGYFIALKHLGAARAVHFVSLVPVSTALTAWPMLDEPVTLRMALGMALALAGVSIVVSARSTTPAATAPSTSAALGIAGGAVYCVTQALANVLLKGTDPSLSPLSLSVVRLAVGALILGVWLASTRKGRAAVVGLRPVLAKATLATAVGTYVGLLMGVYALRTVSAGVATTLIATTPIFALVLTRERPKPRALVGATLALVGVAVLMW